MPNLKPQQLVEQLNIRVNKHINTLFENAQPAAKLANGLMNKISAVANNLLQTAKDCSDVAVRAVQRYIFVGPNAKNVVDSVQIQPTSPEPGPTSPSSSGGGRKQ